MALSSHDKMSPLLLPLAIPVGVMAPTTAATLAVGTACTVDNIEYMVVWGVTAQR